ncbi:MAG TPA: hypothetical protein VF212_02330 [Longimicrobiales bacterium]
MDIERVDLSALDPAADAERWERLVRRIMAGAAPELARRAATRDPFTLLASWARPMIAAAAAITVISFAVLRRTPGPVEIGSTASRGIVEALEVPSPAADWLNEDRAPTVTDLVSVLEADNR